MTKIFLHVFLIIFLAGCNAINEPFDTIFKDQAESNSPIVELVIDKSYFCTGVVISPSEIITSSLCTKEEYVKNRLEIKGDTNKSVIFLLDDIQTIGEGLSSLVVVSGFETTQKYINIAPQKPSEGDKIVLIGYDCNEEFFILERFEWPGNNQQLEVHDCIANPGILALNLNGDLIGLVSRYDDKSENIGLITLEEVSQ